MRASFINLIEIEMISTTLLGAKLLSNFLIYFAVTRSSEKV